MDDPLLLKVAAVVFALLLLGLVLTIYEFKTKIFIKTDTKITKKSNKSKIVSK